MLNSFHNPDVLTCLAHLSSDEVFTPPNIANEMLDTLPNEIWSDKNITFLDPSLKTGVFLREITKRLLKGLESEIPNLEDRLDHILKNQVFGISITKITGEISRRTLYCSKTANGEYSIVDFGDEDGNIKYFHYDHFWADGVRCKYCGVNKKLYERNKGLESYAYSFIHEDKPEELFNMKFDVIIGNPPYQMSDGSGKGAGATPIYDKFVEQAIKLKPRYLCMIIPSRWFSGGRGLDTFRKTMLQDKRIKEIHDYADASECFPGVEIKGGVNYFLWSRDYSGKCKFISYHENKKISESDRDLSDFNFLVRYNGAISILDKMKNKGFESFIKFVLPAKPFGFRTYFKGSDKKSNDSIKIFVNKGTGYVDRNEVKVNHHLIDEHKVIVPYAFGSGDPSSDRLKPIYSPPGSCCSETYLVLGPLNSKKECDNLISFLNTKFFHFCITIKKNTQHATRNAYELVPLMDFSNPWTDKDLFKYFDIDKKEIDYIDRLIW
tara:strand:+ start:1575 stop:3053 length:1479 start_codon:yes stop_codon:yes gene_type:complete